MLLVVLSVATAARTAAALGGVLHGFHDFVVPGAAAQVSRQLESDFFFRGIRIVTQQSFRRHNESRRTNTALQGGIFQEGVLQWREAVFGVDSFDGFD